MRYGREQKDLKKSDFKRKLKEEIKKQLDTTEENLIELNYHDNKEKEKIKNILLLFNVISTMKAQNTYFPFKKYMDEKWSLEHIHAQHSEDLTTDAQRSLLLKEQQGYYEKIGNDALKNKINELLQQAKIDVSGFNALQEEIFNQFTDEKNVYNNDTIDNLALLSSSDNAALSNTIFPIKRDKIIDMDRTGKFIPLCTKNVFLKYYSDDVEQNVIWARKDRDAYLKAIKKMFNDYLEEESKNE